MFANFEVLKLPADRPDLSNLIFLLIFAAVILGTGQKRSPSALLERPQTDQLRGLAILLIILGHLWTHVFGGGSHLILSADAVALFLLVSGYGLGSSITTGLDPRRYFARRVRRVMAPYWAVTTLILILDYMLLGRSYRALDLLLTFAGINVSPATQELDYVRWYVTFILFWYIAFYLAVRLFGGPKRPFVLLAVSILLFPIHYYFFRFGWYQFLAFPIGCALGAHHDKVQSFYRSHERGLKKWAVAAGSIVVIWRIIVGTPAWEQAIYSRLPNILLALFEEGIGLLCCSALIIGMAQFGAIGYRSKFLLFFGSLSYELYLLHGAFLVKYNAFIRSGTLFDLTLSFILFLMFVTAMSYLLNRVLGGAPAKGPRWTVDHP
jgi:peptidoglycan/LPS O-acetylase OafA/YrhL